MKVGWRVAPLGNVASFVMGQAPPGAASNFDGVGTPFVKAGEFGPDRPTIREWTTDPKKFAKATDVLICVVGATCGKINLGADCAIGRSVAAIRPQPAALDQFFLHYFLEGQVLALRGGSLGAAQTVISKDMLADLPISLPPLDEQKRIVAVLDEAFEGLSRARANAEANLADARELYSTLTSSAFLPGAEGWREAALCDVADFRNGLNFTRASKGQRLKIVGVGDFQGNWQVPIDELAEVVIDGKLAKDDHLCPGDILAVRSNGNKALIGRVMLVPETTETISFSGFTIRIRLKSSDVLPEYLLQFMRSPKVRETLTSGGGGSNISNLNQGQLSRLRISFPSKDDQGLILEGIYAAAEGMNDLRRQYERQRQDLDTLRQSLLQRAFSGELIR